MSFSERSYSGKLFRPTPEVRIEEDGSFGVIATSWGNRQAAKKAIDILTDYTLSARQDTEVTSAFQTLTCLSALANNLRVGVMLVNDTLYREDNKSEHATGIELLVFSHFNNELSFAQVGSPHFLLARRGLPWIPLGVQIDLSTEMSRPPEILPPLPQNLLGLHPTTNMIVTSFRTQPGDRLIFLSHSIIAPPLCLVPYDRTDLATVSMTLAKDYPELPFWLGIFQLKG